MKSNYNALLKKPLLMQILTNTLHHILCATLSLRTYCKAALIYAQYKHNLGTVTCVLQQGANGVISPFSRL
ncbi:hypothetical protein D172_008985 [Pseudoalteromonas sp. Bsw20308]|nr:hypothetical protein D172_008985 [Pseudoalteromonas sp. Bsw20308]